MKAIAKLEDGEKVVGEGKEMPLGMEGIGGKGAIRKEEVDRAMGFIDELMTGNLKIGYLRNAYGDEEGHMPVLVALGGKSEIEDGFYINTWDVKDRFKENSYKWKHMVERYYGEGYVSNGAFIFASLLAREKYGKDKVIIETRSDSLNADITFISPHLRDRIAWLLEEYRKKRGR